MLKNDKPVSLPPAIQTFVNNFPVVTVTTITNHQTVVHAVSEGKRCNNIPKRNG
jgi:hypothetical protein